MGVELKSRLDGQNKMIFSKVLLCTGNMYKRRREERSKGLWHGGTETEERAVRSRAVVRMAEGEYEFNRFGFTCRWEVRGFGRVAE